MKRLAMYRINQVIPEIDAKPGDVLVNDPTDGLRLVRRISASAGGILSGSGVTELFSYPPAPVEYVLADASGDR